MGYFYVNSDCRDDPRMLEAADLLDLPPVAVVGSMICLWAWASRHGRPFNLVGVKPSVLAKVAAYQGDPTRLADALKIARLIGTQADVSDLVSPDAMEAD